ncbi:S41 family peptidase [Micromonospora sp. DR5-3]|uniref:S41 family peptidase n=1 Tax=unclassified Micromonospora TaxID=2617518 RepID=UPI0011D7F052|nr:MULTISPECIES: S41 family peptidase [unclassified Micromonospora]MCW3819391.1 S41 family peptidase [Micromonospora sp. DR5-3]TYC20816.1 peptidase [Micromonospora sp. MP36]
MSTIEQAYHCIFERWYGGRTLDNRVLLTAAFAGFTQELNRRGLEAADATMPPLTGDRQHDWAAFRAVYERVGGDLPDDAALRQALAAATITAMVSMLRDNHARWQYVELPPGYQPGYEYGLGIATSPSSGLTRNAPQEALPPLYVNSVRGGPAADKALRPGDIIESVNGAPPFAAGILSTGAVEQLYPQYPDADPVRLALRRPATGRTWAVTLKPALFKPTAEATTTMTSQLLRGGVAYFRLTGFTQKSADLVLQAIAELRNSRRLRGVVLDLRGNRGGSPTEANRLLGAFTHGKTTAYHCDADSNCTANRTDDTVPLLNLPLVVLTDRDCASACDHFSSAVKDLQLGPLIGTRTSGIIAGPSAPYLLNDNSLLLLPALRHLGPNRELIDGVGVAPDHYLPLTAKDVSTGRDPAIAKALTLLDH